ncbi:hypothetical protein ACIBUY_04050 [Streptomyces sp. NPDC050085]|uniref:hypothetical protein n=1 Tax=Streptomyces sp. NPDC050085 TaxID=3365600 RepID=UPI0037A5BB48
MRLRILPLLLAIAATAGCATTPSPRSTAPTSASGAAASAGARRSADAPLSTTALHKLLLTRTDLGPDYVAAPASSGSSQAISPADCPALAQLAEHAEGPFTSAHRVTTAFQHNGAPGTPITEELYSDRGDRLSRAADQLFAAFRSCSKFTLGATTSVRVRAASAPSRLGTERWGHSLIIHAATGTSEVTQFAVRCGTVLVMLSAPSETALRHLPQAVDRVGCAA